MSGLEFFVFSAVNLQKRQACPPASEQTVRVKAEKATVKTKPKKREKKAKGRPQGGLNKDKTRFGIVE